MADHGSDPQKEKAPEQIYFSGEVDCPVFEAHFLKPNICSSCMKLIDKHQKEAIPSDDCIVKALEYSSKGLMFPSLILEKDTESNLGAVYLGGFQAAVNEKFIEKEHVTHILNVAGKALGLFFGPRNRENAKRIHEKFGVNILDLDWEDSMKFQITDTDFRDAAVFIQQGRKAGGSVLVHCAQGKSRSGSALCAYIMAVKQMEMIQALELIQSKRKMVDPNPNFRMLLKKLEKSETLKQLTEELATM